VGDLWDLFPAVFLLAWAAYNWVCYKYPESVPNPFGLNAHRLGEDTSTDEEDESMSREYDGTWSWVVATDNFDEYEEHGGAVAQLGLDRADPEEREEFDVKDVPLTRNERSILRRAVEEYLDKAGQIRGMPEAEGWLRAVWWVLVDLDEAKHLDELAEDSPDVVDHEAWREEVQERTGTDPVTGVEVEE